MTNWDFLEQYRKLDDLLRYREIRLKSLKEKCLSIPSPRFDKEFTTGSRDNRSPQEKAMAAVFREQEAIEKCRKVQQDLEEQITNSMDQLTNLQDRTLIELYFLHHYTWRSLGKILACDHKSAKRWTEEAARKMKLPEKPVDIDMLL